MNARLMMALIVVLMASVANVAMAWTVTERVNCAGSLSVADPLGETTETYVVGDRSTRVSITARIGYAPPLSADYIELPVADDRLPTWSSRTKPLLRRWANNLFGWMRRNHVVQFELGPNEDLDSAKIQAFAAELERRGYTRESLAQRAFDVRLGSLQFTGEEFWTALKGAADRGRYVSVNAERNFNAEPGRFRSVFVPQTLTWLARGLLATAIGSVIWHQIDPGVSLAQNAMQGAAVMLFAGQIAEIAGDLTEETEGRPFWRGVRRLLLLLPTVGGLVDTARLPSVVDQRIKVVIKNMADALARYPDLSTVQIVTESPEDFDRVRVAVKAHFAEAKRLEQEREEATWDQADPTFAKFPFRLRGGMPNLKHRPTRDLVESLTKTFRPRRFSSVDEFLNYYRPENVPGWAEGRHDYTFQQYVGMYLFDSLRWSLPQFFKLGPTPEQVRTLLNLPGQHFDRRQLHEFPSGNAALGTFALIALEARRHFAAHPDQAQVALTDVTPLAAFEWERLVRYFNDEQRLLNALSTYAKAFRPAPKSFTRLDENHPALTPPVPLDARFTFPEDGW